MTVVRKIFMNIKKRYVFLRGLGFILFISTSFLLLSKGKLRRLFYFNSGYTQFRCEPFDRSVPYFHTKINISKGVNLWCESCNELNTVQILSAIEQFTKCDTDNKPFQNCTFENVKLEIAESDRLQIVE